MSLVWMEVWAISAGVVIHWRRVGGGVSTNPSLSSIYGSMMLVNIRMKRRWERLLKTLLVIRMGCIGWPLQLMILIAGMR